MARYLDKEQDVVTSLERLRRQPKRDHGVRGDNRNVLPAVHFIGHRTGSSATLERRFEYLLSGPGVEAIEVDADALKHEIAGCRKVPSGGGTGQFRVPRLEARGGIVCRH